MIIGGWSAILHGSRLGRIVRALAPYHLRLRDVPERLSLVWDQTTRRNGPSFTLNPDLDGIDLLAEISGLGIFEEVEAASATVEAFGLHVRTLDLKSLIRAKRAVGREKDLRTLPEPESLLEAEEP